MATSRQGLRASTWILALLLSACGQTSSDGNPDLGRGGQGASPSSGGAVAATGGTSGGESGTSGGASVVTGGTSATGGQLSGGSSGAAGAVASGGKHTGGAGGLASGGKSTGGAGGSASGGTSAGAAGSAGAGGEPECAAIKCAAVCAENWLGLDGCPTCACAPPAPKLSSSDVSCPSASLTMTATSSVFIGGINRWLIDFEWTCSEHGALGGPIRAHLQIGLVQPLSPPIDAQNRTFFYPRSSAGNLEYEVRAANLWLQGSGVPEIEQRLTPTTSFLSVRLENGLLVGGVEFNGSDSTSKITGSMAGPFSVAVPKTI